MTSPTKSLDATLSLFKKKGVARAPRKAQFNFVLTLGPPHLVQINGSLVSELQCSADEARADVERRAAKCRALGQTTNIEVYGS